MIQIKYVIHNNQNPGFKQVEKRGKNRNAVIFIFDYSSPLFYFISFLFTLLKWSISIDATIIIIPISDMLRQIKPGLIADKSGRHLKK